MSTTDIQLVGGSTTLLSLATTAILSSYTNSGSLYCTSGDQTFFLTVVKNATIGTVTFRAQVSSDDTNFMDVQSTRQDTGASANEHALTVAGAGAYRLAITCNSAKRATSMRIGVKADVQGGTGESITITGKAW